MVKVLVFGMNENPGGVESVIMNYYRAIDKEKIHFDFICNFYEKCAYEDEIVSLGGKVYHIAMRSRQFIRYRRELKEFFEKHASEYDIIWVNVCSLANIDYLIMAKKYGIKKRIIHSHNSQNMDSRLRGILHKHNKKKLKTYATDFWSCSQSASEWFYDEELRKKAVIINNAIDVDKYIFSQEKREKIRKHIGWEDNFLVGNVGRLHFQKNQTFAIDVFSKLIEKMPEARLVLVGQGEDEEKLRIQVRDAGLSDKVYFAGVQSDMQAWLSVMDVFLFPSLFEGLSLSLLEAQANGLPVIASDKVIAMESKVSDNFSFVELDRGAEYWSQKIYENRNCARTEYTEIKEKFRQSGYDIKTQAKLVENIMKEVE